MFVHFFKYQLKILLQNRIVIFWTLVFPMILATFFNLAFSNLLNNEQFNPVAVAIISDEENHPFKSLLNDLSNQEDPIINLIEVDKNKVNELLENKNISGYYIVDNEIELIVNDNGINETILESIANQYLRIQNSYRNIITNSQTIKDNILTEINFNQDNLQQVPVSKNNDATVIYFYTLIGMNCFNACYCGLQTTTKVEANLSRQGTRINVAPISKTIIVLSGILASFLIQFINMMLLLVYLNYGLNVSFSNQLPYILLLVAVGCFTGVTIGCFVGNGLKTKNENFKFNFLTSLSLILSFFSGMMILDIKYWMQNHLPILNYLNPVNLITDGLYALYYYDHLNRYFINIICLIIIGILLLITSIRFSQRRQYDSL